MTLPDHDGSGEEVVSLNGASSTDSDGVITGYEWKEGSTLLGTTAQLTTTMGVGTHLLTLTVTDNGGAVSTDDLIVTVASNLPPTANAGPDQAVRFDAPVLLLDASDSTDPDGTIVSYEWDFGDGTMGSGLSPDHVYPSLGTYTVVLTVTDNGGLTHSDSLTVTVYFKELFSDSFEVGEWNGLWTEDSQDRWFRSTERTVDGSFSAEIVGSEGSPEGILTSTPVDLRFPRGPIS